ncbi:MAG: 16S rRNA (uracil(1498)-N(3))-methyltransferase [Syntrophales bacterium]|nr:16S rRNA (uracil(1498)-N(3))-methyltransferase [Syntrophales bacterium]MDD5532934.1 16S rRNA (uracil(1498)-N(3))-methyltransferase [Syntrophales bacterium]
MTIPRIYFPKETETGRTEELAGDDYRYIRNILRLRKGERMILFGLGEFEFEGVLKDYGPHSAIVGVVGRKPFPKPDLRITLVQALPKGEKMDLIVQKATELGVDRLVAVVSSRSIPRLTPEKARRRVDRWRKIALEASRQCGRGDVPEISEIESFEEAVSRPGGNALRLILWEAEADRGLKEILRGGESAGAKNIEVVIGPEGGLSGEEVEEARRHGFVSAGLGSRVLKVETAAIAVITIVQYELGTMGAEMKKEIR